MPRKLTPEQAKAMLEKRRAQDPCLHYTPPVTLGRASECKARYICIQAVNQVGKTAWMQYVCASVLRGRNKNWASFGPVSILLVVPKRALAAAVWGDRLLKRSSLVDATGKHPWIPKREIEHVTWAFSPAGSYPGKILMKDGSQLITILSGDPNSWKGIEGMTFDMVIRDEVAGNENLGDELQPRLLASRTRALAGLQPWGGVVIWAATETKHNDEWLAFLGRAKDSIIDHALFCPQPEEAAAYISMEAREEMRNTMSAKAYRIRGEGTLTASEAVSIFADQWDDKRHLLPMDYVIKDDDNVHIGWDPGVDHPTGMLVGVVTKEDPTQLRIVKCWEHSNETLDYDVECLHSFLLGRKIAGFVYDHAAGIRLKHAPSLFHKLVETMDRRGYVPLAGYIKSDKRVDIGIDTLRTMLDPERYNRNAVPRLVLNPSKESGCQLLRSEIIGYHRSEATAMSKGKIVKKNDDALDCLPAGTMILTEHGERPIEDIAVGDLVWTRLGLRPVTDAWSSSDCTPVVSTKVNGRTLTATPGHRVWTVNRGWIPLASLMPEDTLETCQTSLSSKVSATTNASEQRRGASRTGLVNCSTGTYGKRRRGRSQMVIPSITLMAIAGTTTYRTSPVCRRANMRATTGWSRRDLCCWRKLGRWQPSGMGRQRDWRGMRNMALMPTPSAHASGTRAKSAGRRFRASTREGRAFAAIAARPSGVARQGLTTATRRVSNAGQPIGTTASPSAFAVSHATQQPREAGVCKVHDLTVADAHEFYANGVLVHNCLRYMSRSFPTWTSAYRCGPPTFVVDAPLQHAPLRINVPESEKTPMERRAALSKQLANRTKASIRAAFIPRR